MVEWVRQVALTWHADAEPYEFADYIIAFAFGNRPPANGGDPATTLAEPGPTNEALADVIAAMVRTKRVPVYAQWEIARILESKHHVNNVVSIEPVIEEDGTIVYLSTDGVAKQVAELQADLPGGPGRASVVGFRDHHKRCVLTCRANDLVAHAPEGVAMPRDYDAESGQVWTRYRPVRHGGAAGSSSGGAARGRRRESVHTLQVSSVAPAVGPAVAPRGQFGQVARE
ncbi:MAG TPA: hypothetical protein VIQ30_08760 [Pseudonocardia sp.]